MEGNVLPMGSRKCFVATAAFIVESGDPLRRTVVPTETRLFKLLLERDSPGHRASDISGKRPQV